MARRCRGDPKDAAVPRHEIGVLPRLQAERGAAQSFGARDRGEHAWHGRQHHPRVRRQRDDVGITRAGRDRRLREQRGYIVAGQALQFGYHGIGLRSRK